MAAAGKLDGEMLSWLECKPVEGEPGIAEDPPTAKSQFYNWSGTWPALSLAFGVSR